MVKRKKNIRIFEGNQIMITFLSDTIGSFAIQVGILLIQLFPFLPESFASNPGQLMIIVGFAGQGLFAMRFLLQWLTSEGEGRSVIPIGFWYFSIGGGTVLLLYAIWRKDPVIICGQGLGLFIYLRNLYLIYRPRQDRS